MVPRLRFPLPRKAYGRQAWIRLAIQVRDRSSLEAPFSYRELSRLLEHDPEKWVPVFPNATRLRGGSCSSKQIERDDDSKKSRRALERSTKWSVEPWLRRREAIRLTSVSETVAFLI